MQTIYSFRIVAVLMLASLAVISIGISMNAYAQNTTQTTNMTNMTGLAPGPFESDDAGEGDEEGPGEDEDEPGDVDTNDKED
jgi:hypothetical protein